MKRQVVTVFAIQMLGLSVAYAAGALPAAYRVTSIGTLPGGAPSHGNWINGNGDVAGTAADANNGYNNAAVLYSAGGGTLTNLGGLNIQYAISSEGLAINDIGQVAGDTSNGSPHAFLYSGSQAHDLVTLPNVISSQPFAINNSTQTVGNIAIMVNPSTVVWHAFFSDGVTMTDLTEALGDPDYSEAHGINAAGQIVGWRRASGLDSHAFLLTGSSALDLGTLGGANSGAQAVNDSGHVVGWSYVPASNGTHAFIYSGGTMVDIGVLSGAQSASATSINSSGVVVGTARFPGYSSNTRGFVYASGVLQDLNDLIPPTSGWLLKQANAVNDRGQIAGSGVRNGAILGFVLTPINPGDLNCDGTVNNQDIDAFVMALFNPVGYAAQYPGCDILNGDFTGDGIVNNQDIDSFVAALFGG